MLRVTTFASAMLAALGIIALGAISVSASGHEFLASRTGRTTSKGTTVQVFTVGAGTIECSTVAGSGEVTATKSTVHRESLTYSGCEAFGFSRVNITPVKFEFSANGSAKLEKGVTITPEGAGCDVLIPAQTVTNLTYTNEPEGRLLASASVGGIRSKGTGGACGGESTEGSYSGKLLASLEGGTVEWK
jgi:hypothetical protein